MATQTPKIDYTAMSKNKTTAELMKMTNDLREEKRVAVAKENAEYKFPSTYNPSKGLRAGKVYELRMFFHVIPGRAEALKKELLKFQESEERNSKAVHIMTGIQDMSGTLFDNDTRYLHCTEFDTEWEPYIDDSVPTDKQRLIYANWMQHLEETKQYTPDNLPTANDIKVAYKAAQVPSTCFIRTFGESVTEEYKMRDVMKAFDEVLKHPDAEKALAHPALKPLLDLAAD